MDGIEAVGRIRRRRRPLPQAGSRCRSASRRAAVGLPFETPEDVEEATQRMMEPYASTEYPHLSRFVNEHIMRPGYEFAEEFEYGLDLILDALERKVADRSSQPSPVRSI